MPSVKVPLGIVRTLLSAWLAAPLCAQTLSVKSPTVLLNSSEARSTEVTVFEGPPVKYTVTGQPAWLSISSDNRYTTPDTLSFQLTSSICGSCTAAMTLLPEGGGPATPITVRYSPPGVPSETVLALSSSSVTLNNTQARSITVSGPNGTTVPYTVNHAPDWLRIDSAHQYTTPDTLSIQMSSSLCGDCRAELTLLPAGGAKGAPLVVTYNTNGGSTYHTSISHVTLTYPAGAGGDCYTGAVSSCTVELKSDIASVKTYSAKVEHTDRDNWLLLNNMAGMVGGVPVGNGLVLTVNPAIAPSLPTGQYAGQVVVFNRENSADLAIVDVSLLVNPGEISISPSAGAGNSQTFVMQFPHPAGWQNLHVINILINGSLEWRQSCYMAYEVPIATLHLTDDEAKAQGPEGSIALGKPGTVANSQCTVRLISANGEGNLLTLTLNLTFKPGFTGKKIIYLAARDKARNNSGWLPKGTWEVKPPPPPPARKKK